jgi:hypothetical protein
MTSRSRPVPLPALIARPNRLVARLILAELLAKRGKGPLEPRVIGYRPIRR